MTIEEAKKIYKAVKRNNFFIENIDKDFFLEFTAILFEQLKQIGKGQQELISSRRKWKRRYYNERRKVRELKRKVK